MFAPLISHPWAYPALEVVHILGIALLLGNLLVLEVRVFGVAKALPVQALARSAPPHQRLAGWGLPRLQALEP